jgi:5-methylcytosine-specific restriction endonuclease McrA
LPTRSIIDEDGFLIAAWQFNKEKTPKKIYPYLVQKRGESQKTFDVSLSGKSNSYRGIQPEIFTRKLVIGSFPAESTVRMKERGKPGASGNGWLIRNMRIDEALEKFVSGNTGARDSLESVQETLARDVQKASKASPEDLKRIKESYPRIPEKIVVESTVFRRNPAVVVEVLKRARGICEGCGSNAPFSRRTDGSPYLEVHHKVTLASGGEDTVENAMALCPNCHRREHFG